MCGILAILLADEEQHCNQLLFDGLTLLQHRGQADAAGMITSDGRRLNMRKDNGLVKDVFQQQHMLQLLGNMGIAHCRYPTAGSSSCAEAQPMYTNFPYGICLAHNGNVTNTDELRAAIHREFHHINTGSDSELMLNVLAEELNKSKRPELRPEDVFAAVAGVMRRCRGGYAIVALINGQGTVAFRDPHGIRPLAFGSRPSETAPGRTDWIVASESAPFDTLNFNLERDVGPGEGIFVDAAGRFHRAQCVTDAVVLAPCLFEYVYFARPDSILDKVVVYESRLRMGEALAKKLLRVRPDHEVDVVIPVPDTSRTSALQVAYTLGKPFREGFIKNRYIARTFIMPGQESRKRTVRLKLNTIRSEFRDRNVLLVDDSIVRGTTSMELVQMARDAGARKVFFVSAAPPVRYPNVYGIDIPTRCELIAHGRTEEEIAAKLGADWVMYQDLPDLEDAVRQLNPAIKKFDSSCFSGEYVTGDVDDAYFEHLHNARNDAAMITKNGGCRAAGASPTAAATTNGAANGFNATGNGFAGATNGNGNGHGGDWERADDGGGCRAQRQHSDEVGCESLHNNGGTGDAAVFNGRNDVSCEGLHNGM
ncbi:unnamed protein product [Phaeothamnion confervicola]